MWWWIGAIVAAIVIVAWVKRNPPGPKNYILKAETGVFEAIDVALGLQKGTTQKSKPLVIAADALHDLTSVAVRLSAPVTTAVPTLQSAAAILAAADKALEEILQKPVKLEVVTQTSAPVVPIVPVAVDAP